MSVATGRDLMNEKGVFVNTTGSFIDRVEPGGRFEPESSRYHLYVAYACPFASRCLALCYMKGLQDHIGLSVVHPTWNVTTPPGAEQVHRGWVFTSPDDPPLKTATGYGSFGCAGTIPDTVNNCKSIRELYALANYTNGKYSVPVFWDKKEKTIVCNESAIIIEFLNSSFNSFSTNPTLDLFPSDLRDSMTSVDSWISPNINEGVYRCGFTKSQSIYDQAFDDLFASLDRLEDILSKSRYVCGDRFTASDLRAFVTLVRFDEAYFVYFKTNKKLIRKDYPNIFNYTKEIYQMEGVAKSVHMDHIKMTYYSSHTDLNTYAIVPKGNPDDFSLPHDRNRVY